MLLVATVASHTGKNILSAAKWYILHLYLDNHQKSRLKIRIHTGEKTGKNFSERGLALNPIRTRLFQPSQNF